MSDTMTSSSWRNRPSSKRRKFVSMLSSAEDILKTQKSYASLDFFDFLIDFWAATPHPSAQMVLIVGWATAVAVMNDSSVLSAGLQLNALAGRTMTTIVAFLIVFRTNQSYNRWWEGRILWGKMHWSCVELSQLAASWIEDRHLATRIMNFAIAFAYTVKQCLRREHLDPDHLEGVVSPVEVARMNRMAASVRPYYCTDVIRQCIKKGLTDCPQTHGVQAVARGIDIPVSMLASQFADMARVRNTPQPDCFRVMLQMFTVIYLLLLPVISYEHMGYWIIPEVLFTSYLMLGLQLAAMYLEDPFGYDLVDLDLCLYVEDIKEQCRSSFYLGEKGGYDLTLCDGGAGRNEEAHEIDHDETDAAGECDRTTASYSYAPADDHLSWTAPKSPDTMAPVTTERSPSDKDHTTSENTPPSPPTRNAQMLSVASEEIFDPRVNNVFPSARSKAAAVAHDAGEGAHDQSERSAGAAPPGRPTLNPSGSRLTLSFRHRTQEELAPRRRTKPSKPGRGRAPLGDERSLSPPPVIVQQCRFEKQGPPSSAEVV